jgi:hypothetical protein
MVKIVLILGHIDRDILMRRLDIGIKKFLEIRGEKYRDNEIFGIKNYIMLVPGNGESINKCTEMYEIVNRIIEEKYIIWNCYPGSTHEVIESSFNFLNKMFPSSENVNIDCIICSSAYHLKRLLVISNFLNAYNFKLDYLVTNENISKEQNITELLGINMFLNYYINQNL